MLWLTRSARPPRSRPALRTRLSLERLDARVTPGTLSVDSGAVYSIPTDSGLIAPLAAQGRTIQITDFNAEEVERGWYLFTGQVQGTPAGGLTITFGGSAPSLDGRTATTASDGSFSLLVQVKTDGSDDGTVTAQASDAFGNTSNIMIYDLTPTP